VQLDLGALVGVTPAGVPVGLQFQLSTLFGDSLLDSTATISDVRTETIVPEPAMILLVALGAAFALLHRRC
jgi:hypothetical protein